MAVDAFDTFEYDKAPDYLPGFDRRVAEEDASRKLIEAQMKENDQQREANIKIGANNLKAIQNLAPKAAELYAKHQQEQDKKFQAKAKMLLQMSGFDHDDILKYHDTKTDTYNLHGAFVAAAVEQERLAEQPGANRGHHLELAQQFRGFSGAEQLQVAEISAMSHANNLPTHWLLNKHNYTTEDGTAYDDAKPSEQEEILSRFIADQAYSKVIGVNDILLKDNFADKIESFRKVAAANGATSYANNLAASKEAKVTEGLYTSGSFSVDKLHETIGTLQTDRWSTFNKVDEQLGRKLALRDHFTKIEAGVISGEIPYETYLGLINKEVLHTDGSGRTALYGDLIKNRLGYDPFVKASELGAKLSQQKEAKKDNFIKAEGFKIQKSVEERGNPLHEADVKELMDAWDERDDVKEQNLVGKYPEFLLTAANNTVEDDKDDELIKVLEAQLDDEEIFVDRNKVMMIQDDTKREELLARVDSEEGHGILKTEITSIRTQLGKIVKGKLGLDYGTSGDHPDVKEQVDSAMANYLKYFKQGRNNYESPTANHKAAYDSVKAEINEGIHYEDQRNLDTTTAYRTKIDGIRKWRIKNPEAFLTKGLLPGTEKDFKQLEEWAANPQYGTFPGIYSILAKKLKVKVKTPEGNLRVLGGYEWAAAQYKTMTGKELPPLTGIVAEVKADTSGNFDEFNKQPTTTNAKIAFIRQNNTINNPENLTVGVVT